MTTISNTPIIATIVRLLFGSLFRLFGWRVVGERPKIKKFVLVAVPHVSAWDLVIMLIVANHLSVDLRWLGKRALFKFPFNYFLRWLGGIPAKHESYSSTTDYCVDLFSKHESFVLAVPPEGTRKKVNQWRTGFYTIAQRANVPIALGFIDTANKRSGILEYFVTSGNAEADIALIQSKYKQVLTNYHLPVKSSST